MSNEVINRAGTRTIYTYDQRGRPTTTEVYESGSVTNPNTTHKTYDSLGRLLTITLPNGNGTRYTYDSNGDLTSERRKADMSTPDSPSDLLTTYTRDSVKRVITSITHPDGSLENMTYGPGNRLLTYTRTVHPIPDDTYTRDETTTYTYDGNGRLTTITDPTGRVTSFTYDQYSSLATITRGSGGDTTTTTLTNDPTGDATAITDGENFTLSRTYDAFDRLITEVRPAGGQTHMTYDENNNLTHLRKTLTQTTEAEASFTYDALDLPTEMTVSYDATTNGTTLTQYDSEHRPIKVTYPDGSSLSTTYDPFSRPKTLTRSPAPTDTVSLPQTTTYTYDGNGNLTEVQDPANRTTTLTYDGYDRLTTVTDPLGRTMSFTYDQRSRVLTRTLRDSANVLITKTELTYDEASRPLSRKDLRIESGAIQPSGHREVTLIYDEAGRITTETDALGRVTTRYYDTLGRHTHTVDPL